MRKMRPSADGKILSRYYFITNNGTMQLYLYLYSQNMYTYIIRILNYRVNESEFSIKMNE